MIPIINHKFGRQYSGNFNACDSHQIEIDLWRYGNMWRQAAVESLTKATATNKQIASLANGLSMERDFAVQFVIYGARDASLKASYVTTDRQLAAVRSQSAWPSPRPGDPTELTTQGDLVHLSSVEAFTAALHRVRNRTLMTARLPAANITLASLITFYVDVNEFLLLSVAKTMKVNSSIVYRSILYVA